MPTSEYFTVRFVFVFWVGWGGESRLRIQYHTQVQEEPLEVLTFSSRKIPSMSKQRDEAFTYLNIRLRNRNRIHRLHPKLDMGSQENELSVIMFCKIFPKIIIPPIFQTGKQKRTKLN